MVHVGMIPFVTSYLVFRHTIIVIKNARSQQELPLINHRKLKVLRRGCIGKQDTVCKCLRNMTCHNYHKKFKLLNDLTLHSLYLVAANPFPTLGDSVAIKAHQVTSH